MDEISAALRKKATGFTEEEITEEFCESEGEMRLVKRKVVIKAVPPDLAAIKTLAEQGSEIESMSDEQLAAELERLKNELIKGDKA